MTLSRDGAMYGMSVETGFDGNRGIVCKRLMGYLCRFCFGLFRDGDKAREHTRTQHVGPVHCVRCGVEQLDVMELRDHTATCGFPCGVVGCNLQHKSIVGARNHKKKQCH